MTVLVSGVTVPQVRKGSSGIVRLELNAGSNGNFQAEWMTRGLLTHYALWRGIENPPPTWLIQSIRIQGLLQHKPQMRVLVLRQLRGVSVPSLAQRIQSYDRTNHPAWDYLLYQFLESGGLERRLFKQRLEQFWSNRYDWTQLGLFFVRRYPELNGAELELLWKTFVSETLSSDMAVCLSETASLENLERIAQIEIFKNNQPEVLTQDVWFLHRMDPVALREFSRKQSELEVLAISIHPYYFNACHSLDRVLLAIENDDLDAFRRAARQFSQDMLDAQQLSFETDRLLEKICP